MHDIKYIKENKDDFDNSMIKRGLTPCGSKLLEKYDSYLSSLNLKQSLQEKRNEITKSFKDSKDIEALRQKVSEIKKEIEKISITTEKTFDELNKMLLDIPNMVDSKTPEGKEDCDNKLIKSYGEIKKFNFKPKDHVSLSEKKGNLDYDQAINISGGRFSVLKSELATLNRALINFFVDHNVLDFDYIECVVPELVKSSSLIGTGQLPKFEEDLFQTNFNDLWLIPTSEVPLTNLHRESILDSESLPLRYTSYTNCFRSEAGASGKDTRGLMREHQFGKVEIVSITSPENSMAELERMITCVESIFKKLGLPYRLVELCAGDLGFSSTYTIDIEVWMPGQDKYREVSSCSNCKDFQSRRMMMRVKERKSGKIFFPHTLNGSSVAVGRVIIAILENYQNSDKSVDVPEILLKYMNGIKKIYV